MLDEQAVRLAQAAAGAGIGAAAGAGAGVAAAHAAGVPELGGGAAAVGAAGGAVAGAIGGYADSTLLDPPQQEETHLGKYVAGVVAPLAAIAAGTKVANDYGLTEVTPAKTVGVAAAAMGGGGAGGLGALAAGGLGYGAYKGVQHLVRKANAPVANQTDTELGERQSRGTYRAGSSTQQARSRSNSR